MCILKGDKTKHRNYQSSNAFFCEMSHTTAANVEAGCVEDNSLDAKKS